jgi:putative SbcD/Mre11-related phosphoesterase
MPKRERAGIPGPGGWSFTPEGAVVHRGERTAVIADVHLGYEWARGASGDCLPAHSLDETLRKLARLVDRAAFDRLVVAGDLVESPAPCRRTARSVQALKRWLAQRGVGLHVLAGNHDPGPGRLRGETLDVAGWTIGHGHRPIAAERTISGHLHPVFRHGRAAAPCFLVAPTRIILPAFSPNAAGWNVATGPPLGPRLDLKDLRCVVAEGTDVLDFGLLETLAGRLERVRG